MAKNGASPDAIEETKEFEWLDICEIVEIDKSDDDYNSPHRQDRIGKRVSFGELTGRRDDGFMSCWVVMQEKTEFFPVGSDIKFSAVKLKKVK